MKTTVKMKTTSKMKTMSKMKMTLKMKMTSKMKTTSKFQFDRTTEAITTNKSMVDRGLAIITLNILPPIKEILSLSHQAIGPPISIIIGPLCMHFVTYFLNILQITHI